MIQSLILVTAIGFMSPFASAQECRKEVGQFVYKSATQVGTQLLITEPALMTADGLVALGAVQKDNNYAAVCAQFGYSKSLGDPLLQGHTIYERYAIVNDDGTRIVKGGYKIMSITCTN